MVFSSLFFKEISKNGKRGHGRMFASAKGKQKKKKGGKGGGGGSTATVSGTSVLIISHITFRDCCAHSFCDNFSRNSCILD